MNALFPPRRLTDLELVQTVIEKARVAEIELEAAHRYPEGSAARDWHLKQADKSTLDLLSLINGPNCREAWARIAGLVTPAWPIRMGGAA